MLTVAFLFIGVGAILMFGLYWISCLLFGPASTPPNVEENIVLKRSEFEIEGKPAATEHIGNRYHWPHPFAREAGKASVDVTTHFRYYFNGEAYNCLARKN